MNSSGLTTQIRDNLGLKSLTQLTLTQLTLTQLTLTLTQLTITLTQPTPPSLLPPPYLLLLLLLVLLGEEGVDPPDLGEHAAVGQAEAQAQEPEAELGETGG